MRRSLVGLVKSETKLVTGCLRTTKVVIFVVWDKKGFLAKYEKYGTLYMNDPRPVFEYPKMTCRFETILVGAGTGWAAEW